VKQLTAPQLRAVAKLIVAICSDDSNTIVKAFTEFGFKSEKMDPWVVERIARFYFEGLHSCFSPTLYSYLSLVLFVV
jgi:hypothetical protein